MLDLQPTLQGEQLLLRPLTKEDFGALWKVASDPLIWAQHPVASRSTPEGFKAFFDAALQSLGCVVAIERADGSVIGCSRYHSYAIAQSVTIGYTFLARRCWGTGRNAEMKRLMLDHAFTDVFEVFFLIAEHNLRSRRAVEKLGAEIVGAEDRPSEGQLHIKYRLTPALWTSNATGIYIRPGRAR
ncbi:MAG TPA: GNAT family N-acetyltransferase [Steroidobacteraceae bacterium]|jgi:RimJ/RimL family protein N-acetyltransferase|nr:GNAT family N-acetyltransferase [Steroidobacteraceae bacterium]